jgi:hypothetical protein
MCRHEACAADLPVIGNESVDSAAWRAARCVDNGWRDKPRAANYISCEGQYITDFYEYETPFPSGYSRSPINTDLFRFALSRETRKL